MYLKTSETYIYLKTENISFFCYLKRHVLGIYHVIELHI